MIFESIDTVRFTELYTVKIQLAQFQWRATVCVCIEVNRRSKTFKSDQLFSASHADALRLDRPLGPLPSLGLSFLLDTLLSKHFHSSCNSSSDSTSVIGVLSLSVVVLAVLDFPVIIVTCGGIDVLKCLLSPIMKAYCGRSVRSVEVTALE